MKEQFWNWMVKFNARRFMQRAIAGAILCLILAVLLLVAAFRMDQKLPHNNPRLTQYFANELPEVPRLPQMEYQKKLPSLYNSKYLDQWIASQQALRNKGKKKEPVAIPPPKPKQAPPKPQEKKQLPKKTTLRYAGLMRNTQGVSIAMVDEPKKKTSHTLQAGKTLYGWTIVEVSKKKLVLRHEDKENDEILRYGETRQLEVQEP